MTDAADSLAPPWRRSMPDRNATPHSAFKESDFEYPRLCESCDQWFDDSETVVARDEEAGDPCFICEPCAEAYGVL